MESSHLGDLGNHPLQPPLPLPLPPPTPPPPVTVAVKGSGSGRAAPQVHRPQGA